MIFNMCIHAYRFGHVLDTPHCTLVHTNTLNMLNTREIIHKNDKYVKEMQAYTYTRNMSNYTQAYTHDRSKYTKDTFPFRFFSSLYSFSFSFSCSRSYGHYHETDIPVDSTIIYGHAQL